MGIASQAPARAGLFRSRENRSSGGVSRCRGPFRSAVPMAAVSSWTFSTSQVSRFPPEASIRSRRTATALASPAGRYWKRSVTPPPQTMPRLAASPWTKRKCRRALPPLSRSSAASRWASYSTFPPPMVPRARPPGNTAISAPAPRGVEPLASVTATSSAGVPASRAWTISRTSSRICLILSCIFSYDIVK